MQVRGAAVGTQVGDGGVGKQQVAGGEAAAVVVRQARAAAEERDLEARTRRRGRAQPAGGVPPLGARAEVGAVVAREVDRPAAAHGVGCGVLRGRQGCVAGQRTGQGRQQHRTAVRAHKAV